MGACLFLSIDASSRTFERIGRDRFATLLGRVLGQVRRLPEGAARLAAAGAAHRAWTSWYLGGSWSSVLLVIGDAPIAEASFAPRGVATGPGWSVVLVPEGCSFHEGRCGLTRDRVSAVPAHGRRAISAGADRCPA